MAYWSFFGKKIANGVVTGSTLEKYKVTMDYVAAYIKTLKKDDIMVKEITPMFIEDFFVYLVGLMSNNTAIQKMKHLKKILRMAVEEGYISVSPFKMTLKNEQKEVNPLTLDELRKIKNKKISVPRLAKVRDMFIFECYTGLAFTDMVNLRSENIVVDPKGNEWIIKSRQKTKIQSTIPLLPIAKEIFVKYKEVLPTLTNQRYNGYLKELVCLFLMVLIGVIFIVDDMNITKNFTREELVASATARRLKIDNTPTKEQEARLYLLAY